MFSNRNIFLGETNSIESDPDIAGPKIPTAIKREEPAKKKKRITLTDDDNETNFLLITNLTRPFTGEIRDDAIMCNHVSLSYFLSS